MDLGALLQALTFANMSLAICFNFFSRLLCLDAFICIHNVCSCNSHHSQSCHGNRFHCCFLLKAGRGYHCDLLTGCWTGSQESWVSIRPRPLVFAFPCVAPGRNQQSISVIIFLGACCWAASQTLPSNLWHPKHLPKGLFLHPWAFLTPCCLPLVQNPLAHMPDGLQTSLLPQFPL